MSEHERQRVAHLVLGLDRPMIKIRLPGGRKSRTVPATLSPGVEEHVALRERWSYKANGHAETHDQAARRQQGALARLYKSGAIDAGQLASAEQIARVYEAIGAAVTIKAWSPGIRVDGGRLPGDVLAQQFAQVRGEIAYTRWRAAVSAIGPVSALLEMIIEDMPMTEVAARYRMGKARAKALLIEALNLWPRCLGMARERMGDDWAQDAA